MALLTCLKQKKVHRIKTGLELYRAFQIDPSLPLRFGCTQGQCGVCAIKVIEGQENLSKATKQEKDALASKRLDASYRLACQCAILGDVTIEDGSCLPASKEFPI